MKFIFIAVFLGLPTVEIITFIKVGSFLGLWPTIGIIILTAIIGLAQLRSQGKETLYRAKFSLQENRFPIDEMFDGFCLLIAGILLLTPGFITDVIGFLFIAPYIRTKLRQMFIHYNYFWGHANKNNSTSANSLNPHDPIIIDGEYDDLTKTRHGSDG